MARTYYYAEQGIASEVTSVDATNWTDAITVDVTGEASAVYYVFWSAEIGISVTTSDVKYRVTDGSTVWNAGNFEAKDTTPTQTKSVCGVFKYTHGASQSIVTFRLQMQVEVATSTTGRMRNARLFALKKGATDVDATVSSVALSGNFATLTWTPASTKNYIILYGMGVNSTTAGSACIVEAQLSSPLTTFGRNYFYNTDTANILHGLIVGYAAGLTASSKSVALNAPSGAGTATEILAIALDVTTDTIASKGPTTGSAVPTGTYGDSDALTFTAGAAVPHLTLHGGGQRQASQTVSGYANYMYDGVQFGESVLEGANAVAMGRGIVDLRSLTAASHTVKTQVKSAATTSTVTDANFWVAWQIGDAVLPAVVVPRAMHHRRQLG